ncbi:hypothetical protein [Streptomyces sp. NBC_00091]|uniref:hypothetical protein n=1 Tax=Streptomyces sp. NBC_00091 TaxID=2975648 RepID=UPI00224F23DC|nr:hypothetical protein [Streptomyces sp. NBC_00091]MCX5378539.1 hypothetical protein [Streptomyces sp. NBC_00091]
MAARKTAVRKAAPKCETCGGKGETTETVRVGTRKGRETTDRQTALCSDCWGTGLAH